MGLIIQQRALQAAGGLRQLLPVVRKRDRPLYDQIHRAMNSVVLNIAEGSPSRNEARGRVRLCTPHGGQSGGHRARRSLRDVLEALGALEPSA